MLHNLPKTNVQFLNQCYRTDGENYGVEIQISLQIRSSIPNL